MKPKTCPKCRKAPVTSKGETRWATTCPDCGGLYALGNTADEAIHCWNHCITEGCA